MVYTATADSSPQQKLDFLTRWAGQTPSAEDAKTHSKPVPDR